MRKLPLISLSLAALAALPALWCEATYAAADTTDHREIISRNYDIFTSVVNAVDANYVDSLPLQKMFESAIEGFLEPLDPYTAYYNSKEAKEFLQSSKGEYAGIGAYLMTVGDYVVINNPAEGSPALLAGMRTGDKVLRIDSVDARGIGVEGAREHFLGVPGTTVNVRVSRPYVGADSILDFTLTRSRLVNPTVTYYGVDKDGIGYIELTQFGENSAAEVRDALGRILADKNLKGLVLDLSDNGGGVLESAVDILELFVPKGTTVLTTKGKTRSKDYVTTKAPLLPSSIPMAVLINGSSASASEVTAGVLQDLDRAVLVGTKSYGKGLVQSTLSTPYNTMVKVTTAKYYIPSGRLIQAYDYSRRNSDGSVAHLPDSLAKAFRTKAGRTVYDGGGLSPDSVVSYGEASRILYNLAVDNWIFDYANRYAATHDTIGSPYTFVVTDEIFDDFKKSIDPDRFRYDKNLEGLIKQLRSAAEEEGYLTPEVEKQIGDLEKNLKHDLDRDLDNNRPQIEMLLGPEIISRYYNIRGHVINNLNYDPRYKAAKAILLDRNRYKSMLTAANEKPQSGKKKN